MNNVELYVKALELIAKSDDSRVVWLHDYDVEVYRTKERYTHNGLHWGYANCLVNSALHGAKLECLEGDMSTTYAFFEDDGMAGHSPEGEHAKSFRWNIGDNSRYSKHTLGEVREIVTKNINEKLADARKVQAEMDEVFTKWAQEVETEFPQYKDRVLRIETNDKNLRLITIKPKRYVRRGMGMFFENIQRGEISCSKAALDWLKNAKERSGLMGLEVFANPMLAGFIGIDDTFKSEDVSVAKGAIDKLMPLMTVEN